MSNPRHAKIKWQCRRGMLELDLVLNRFIENQLNALDESQLETFERLLSAQDPELYDWLMGQTLPSDPEIAAFVRFIHLCNRF